MLISFFDDIEQSTFHSRRLQYTFVCFLLCTRYPYRILRMHFISKDSILLLSPFLMVQLSHPYVATGHTRAFMSLALVVNFMPRLFPICFIPVSALFPLPSFLLISLLHSASSAIIDPRY